jgi:hypothetical protein
MILLNLFIGLVGGVLYLISRRVDRAKESLQKIAKYLLNELLLILGIFNAMNVGFAFGIQALYWTQPSTQSAAAQAYSVLMIVCALGATAISFYFFFRRPHLFARFNEAFEQKTFMRYEPLLFYGVRFIMGLLMGALVNFAYAWILVLCLQLAYTLYLIIKRPYAEKKMVVASAFNGGAAIVFIAMTTNAQSGVIDAEVWIVAVCTLLDCLLIFYTLCSKIYGICRIAFRRTSMVHSESVIEPVKSNNVGIQDKSTRRI